MFARFTTTLALAALAAFAHPAPAQEVAWLTDYAAARRDARDQGRPLVIDFSTSNCFWCRKLDETTFRDPAVSAALSAKFVTLKIDAASEPVLTQALRVQAFPTTVIASPDGKILAYVEGYLEPSRMAEQLSRAAEAATKP